MDEIELLRSYGLNLPTPAFLFGAIVFGVCGMAAFRYGIKSERKQLKIIGALLMLYPYAIHQTWLLYLIGVLLCAACFY